MRPKRRKGISRQQWDVIQFLKAKPYNHARWEELKHLVHGQAVLDVMVKRELLQITGRILYRLPSKRKRKPKGTQHA